MDISQHPERVFQRRNFTRRYGKIHVDDTNTLNVHIHALRQDDKYTNSKHVPAIKLSGVWAIKMENQEVENEIKTLVGI